MLKFVLLSICALGAGPAFADLAEGLRVSGSLDMNYVYNFNEPRQVTAPTDTALTQPAANNKYRVFDLYHDSFSLALAEIDLQKTQGPVSVFVALGFGHSADVLSPRDEVSKHILQAYFTYTPVRHPRFSVSAGKMLTHLGLEVAKTRDNWNYSRSILFGYAIPLWHTGVAARYELVPEMLKGALFVYNETVGLYEQGRSKTFGAQLQYMPTENASLTYNALNGNEISADGVTHNRMVHEVIPTLKLADTLSVNADIVYGQLTRARAQNRKTAEWWAWSAGLKWQVGDFYLSPRYENYSDRSGATVETATTTKPALPQRIESETLTLAWNAGDGLELRLEGRRDHSSSGAFPNTQGVLKEAQTTATLGMLYDF